MKRYRELACSLASDLADRVCGLLWEAGTLGAQIEQEEAERIHLKAYFAHEVGLEDLLEDLRAFGVRVQVSTTPVELPDWPDEWKTYFRPFSVGRRLVISPPWERAGAASLEDGIEVIIDPGAAFGTGQHATTALCLTRLQETALQGATCLDVGTGSGILSIAAVKLGAHRVISLDTDLDVWGNFQANCALNCVGRSVSFACGSAHCLDGIRFDCVVANITLNPILKLSSRLCELARGPGAKLIVSGFLEEDIAVVAKAFSKAAPSTCTGHSMQGWGAVEVALK